MLRNLPAENGLLRRQCNDMIRAHAALETAKSSLRNCGFIVIPEAAYALDDVDDLLDVLLSRVGRALDIMTDARDEA